LRDKNRAQAPLPERVAFDSGRLPPKRVAFDLQEKAKNPFFSLFCLDISKKSSNFAARFGWSGIHGL